MPVALETFLSHLSSSGIVPEEKLKVVVSKKASFADGEALARDMINSRLLTKYQAEQILGGKGKGLTMGKYQILEKIGAGGMGQVYKAFHSGTERIVAIKVMLEKSKTDLGLIKRFEREVKAAAKLVHANIITVFDADQADGRIFMVMEYIKGDDLEEILRKKGPLSVSEVVDYILQAAKGLKYAHDQGVIHRDIKPGNILVDSSGNVKIVDMGLAKIEMKGPEEELSRLTADLSVMGTIDYMSPEQAESTKDVDSRADIYSLGATLYYILIGEVLYPEKKTIVQKILSHREMPIPSLCMNRSDVPPSLDIIFTKMVAKKVEDRYASMAEVIAELSEIKMSVTGISVGRIALGSKQLKQVSFPETVDFFDDSKTINGRIGNKGTDSHVGKKMLAYKSGIMQKIYIPKVLAFTGIIVLVLFSLTLLMKPVAKVKEDVKEQNTEQVKLKQKKEAKAKQIDLMNLNVVKEEQEDLGKGVKLDLVLIPAGKFMMGSPASEKGRRDNETQHEVTLTKPYYMGKYEVTQEQWESVVGNNPSIKTKGAKLPVTDVSWNDCQEFIKKLNAKTNGGYRLPTEAEWEFACRAGTSTVYSFGDKITPQDANYGDSKIGKSVAVGSYKPNAFGLYDMHGNVWEWCEDWFAGFPAGAATDPKGPATEGNLVLRGGSFGDADSFARSSYRFVYSPFYRDIYGGFRLARTVDFKTAVAEPAIPNPKPQR
jgi:formylglycine-generating enzyme required for sulfatase activity/tRNA A-37 threonylcarbamoyl transferase component Bud32